MINKSPHRNRTIRDLLNGPIERLIVSGSDSRSIIDSACGMNKYGCTPSPRSRVVHFGSCTSSTVSPIGYKAAQRTRQRLLAVGTDDDLRLSIEECFEELRREILFRITKFAVPGVEVAITPSGTDVELLGLALTAGDGSSKVCNIVVGPSEVGNGTYLAASGCHFDMILPNGSNVIPGDPIDESLAARIDLRKVWLRDESGRERNSDDIDKEVSDIVKEAISCDAIVLLHLVAHSKTGVHAPSLDAVARLRDQFGEKLMIIVDAAQGRFSRRGVIEVLNRGYLTIITGSKFFGGPGFSGALLVPFNAHPHKRNLSSLPEGFGDYVSAGLFPPAWANLRKSLPDTDNIGLLIRWSAAIAEMQEYYATPSRLRLHILRAFESLVPSILGSSKVIKLQPVAPPILSDGVVRLLESKTTVFSFSVRHSNKTQSEMGQDELRNVFRWLNINTSRYLKNASPEERRALAPCLHLGQPVNLGRRDSEGPFVIRIALGAVLLVDIAQNLEHGETIEDRISWLEDLLILLKRKIEVIAAHYKTILDNEEAELKEVQPPVLS